MDIPWFYAADLTETTRDYLLDEDSSKHAIRVLRMQAGTDVCLTNGGGLLASARIVDAHPKRCRLQLETVRILPPRRPLRAVAVAPTKNASRLEWFLEKATELGLSEIFLIHTERSERQQVKTERLHHILVSAMLQSRQVYLPRLHPLQPLSDLLQHPEYPERLLAWCGERDKRHLTEALRPGAAVLVLIGPEGDFSQSEVDQALQHGCQLVSLGDTRLRVETAALMSAVVLTLPPHP